MNESISKVTLELAEQYAELIHRDRPSQDTIKTILELMVLRGHREAIEVANKIVDKCLGGANVNPR